MTYYRNQTDPLSGETLDIQYDDAWETEKDYKLMEPLEEQLPSARHAYRRRVDRMVERAAEVPLFLRPCLRESETYDFFISYASEDRESFVHELALQLREAGAKIWYDRFILRPGHSLRRQIDEGLANSLFGVAVLSPHFFAKSWTQKELAGLIALETHYGEERIFPLWHGITRDQVALHSPMLLDRVALETRKYPIEKIVEKLLRAKELQLAKRKGGAYS